MSEVPDEILVKIFIFVPSNENNSLETGVIETIYRGLSRSKNTILDSSLIIFETLVLTRNMQKF